MEENESCGSRLNSRSDEWMASIELMDELWFRQNMFSVGVAAEIDGVESCRKIEVNKDEELTFTAADHGAPEQELSEAISSLVISDPTDEPSLLDHSLQRAPSLPSYKEEARLTKEKSSPRKISANKPSLQRSFSSFNSCPAVPFSRNDQSSSKESEKRPSIPKPLRRGMSGDLRPISQSRGRKSLSDLEEEEVQGFRDLGFTFNKEDINQDLMNMLPGLQEKKPVVDEQQARRPYLSEAWMVKKSPSPPKLNWVERSSGHDMKEQLRIWAKDVASNFNVENS